MTSASPPSWPGAFGAEPRRRRSLSRELIVETALKVVDTEGLDALNMRRVAQELGTGAASLYAHVANKDELLALLLDRVAADLEHPVPDPARWREQAKEFLRSSRENLAAHADLSRAMLEQNIPTSPAMLDSAETMLGLLRAGGLPEQVCAYGVDVISLYLVATTVEEAMRRKPGQQARQGQQGAEERAEDGTEDGTDDGTETAYLDGITSFFGSLPTDRYPLIVAMAPALTRNVGDERFEFGLDLLLDGLVAQAGRSYG